MKKNDFPIDITTALDMDLINIINFGKGVQELRETREKAIEELKKRENLSDDESVRKYIQGKLKEQDELRQNKWAEFSKEGAVFTYKQRPHVFETIRKYSPPVEMVAKEVVLTRVRGTSKFTCFNDMRTYGLVKLEDAIPIYTNCIPEQRGLIKANEKPKEREKGKPVQDLEDWFGFDKKTVFYHRGFNESFEVVEKYGLPDRERTKENEVILARSHKRPLFVEFTPLDLLLMEITPNTPPKFKSWNVYDLEK